MNRPFIFAAAAGAATIATAALLTLQVGDDARTVAVTSAPQDRVAPMMDPLEASHGDYLVPAHVCADPDDEKYNDCIPWSSVGENAVFAPRRAD